MKRDLFRKIIITYLIIAPVLFISLELYLSRVVKDDHIRRLEEDLLIQSRLIGEQVRFLSPADSLDRVCRKYKEKTGARVTIIDGSGRVLGDSDEPSAGMDNHLDRPEILEASLSGVGSSVRYSKTIRRDLFYLAYTIEGNGEKRFLRLSIPLDRVEFEMGRIRIRVIAASLMALVITMVIAILQARKISRSVGQIAGFSREIAAGNFGRRLLLQDKGEIGELARNMNEMAHELKMRLDQSEEEKHKVEAILRNLSDGLMLIDARGRIIRSNEAITGLFGGVASPLEGCMLMEAVRNAEVSDIVQKVVETEQPQHGEVSVLYPRERYLMATAAPFYGHSPEKELVGVLLMLHDITRLKHLEEMRKDFVANVSHEIKTPLTAIKGFAETLLGGALDDKENALKFLGAIKNHSERLDSLVNDLLTLSRIEFGDITLDLSPVHPDDVIDVAFTTLKEKAGRKGLFLRREIADDIEYITADRNRLIQILLNLVDNGIKFTEDGGVTVRAQLAQAGDSCELSVEDTGAGVPAKDLPRLGERFYRVDRARSRELGGTGLGLAIVKHLVKVHGWDMRIESTQGKGTRVVIRIPIERPQSMSRG